MDISYDLHTHSTASDGVLSPSELVQQAALVGGCVLALTDHDTTGGLREAAITASKTGSWVIPGVEISVTWQGCTVHVVGLNIDQNNSLLQSGLTRLREFRAWRAIEIGNSLAKHNIAMAYEGAKALAKGELISRSHFARFLVQQGFAVDERQVFRHFLTKGKPGYIPGQWASLDDAVQWIVQAQGQAVLAHPARYGLGYRGLRQLVASFREVGGVALEVVSGSHRVEDSLAIARLSKEFSLLSSAGSDFHSNQASLIELGRLPSLPDGCVPIWRDWS